MRLFFLTNGYPPDRWGGTETYTAGLARRCLGQFGHDVHVICAGTWDRGPAHLNGIDVADQDGVTVHRLALNWTKAADSARSLYDNAAVAAHLRELIASHRPDIVHVTSCETLSASPLRVVKAAGIPQVLSLTDFWFLCPRITLLTSRGDNCTGRTTPWDCLECQLHGRPVFETPRRLLPAAAHRAVISAVSRRPSLTRWRGLRGWAGDMADRKRALLQALALPEVRLAATEFTRRVFVDAGITAPIEVHPYGHDLDWVNALPARRETAVPLRVAFVGQLTPAKAPHLLLEALATLPAEIRARLAVKIYGNLRQSAEYGARLERLAAALGPNVVLAGTYRHEDSAAVFGAIDVLVVPSVWFDFPLIIYEAFAAGVPVVATDLGALAEIVTHEVNGLHFARGSTAALAAALQRLVDEPGLVERLRAGAPPVRRVEAEVTELETLYRSLITRRGRGGAGRSV